MSTDIPKPAKRTGKATAPGLGKGDQQKRGQGSSETVPQRPRARRSQAERREQIAKATYELVGQYGVRGTTVQLIADAIGVTPQALYAHFSNRYEMLVAALDCYYELAKLSPEHYESANVLEDLRQLLYRHVETKGLDLMTFASPHFEFVVAPRDTDLATRFGEMQLKALESVAALIEEGQRQGSIRKDLDPMIGAWRTAAFAWTEEIALLIGRDEYISKGYSRNLADLLIDDMAPRPDGENRTDPS
ncbi:MAG: TetR/AcrR family transcriptional regulator [Thermoleophilia bacterium]|nr:TetR/AcrR family transcriptional regulator [Thermoleophilia bacterium]